MPEKISVIRDAKYICTVPQALGQPKKFSILANERVEGGRLILETESGVTFIVPLVPNA